MPDPTSPSSNPVRRNRWCDSAWGPLLLALIVSLTFMSIPRVTPIPDPDYSWSATLSYAHQQGLQFGTDVVFTYGPLGFLVTRYYSTDAAGLRLLVNALLAFSIAAGVCLLAWRLSWRWRVVMLGGFVFAAANVDPRVDMLINCGLVSWGLLCLVESGPRLKWSIGCLAVLAAVSGLMKVTHLFSAGLTIAVVAGDLWLRGRRGLGGALVGGYGAASLLGWWLAGQSVGHLQAFAAGIVALVHGYNQSMALAGAPSLKWRGVAMAILAAMTVAGRAWTAFGPAAEDTTGRRRLCCRRSLVFGWLSGMLFLSWKHGFVITDQYHAGFFFGFMPLLMLALEGLTPRANRGGWVLCVWRVTGLACFLLALNSMQALLLGNLAGALRQPLTAVGQNLRTLLQPAQYRREMETAVESVRQQLSLPACRQLIGDKSVDVFGFLQCHALLNNLNYHPRPVLQSYAAYNAPLMRLDEQYYLSSRAPEFVLFCLQPMWRRFPSLEDARLLRHLLLNFEPVAAEEPFLVLRARAGAPAKLTLLADRTTRLGERIALDAFGDADLWMEVDIEPTWLGRVRQLFYQPGRARLAAWPDAAREQGSRPLLRQSAPAPMLAAGFLASPLVQNNDDVLDLLTGNRIRRPGAYSIEVLPEDLRFWRPTVRFRVYRIENPLGRWAPRERARALKYPGFQADPSEIISASDYGVRTVHGQPVLRVAPRGFLRFVVPAGAKTLSGTWGVLKTDSRESPPASIALSIEHIPTGGQPQRLLAQPLDAGLVSQDGSQQHFSVALPESPEGDVWLKVVADPGGNPAPACSCWAGIRFE